MEERLGLLTLAFFLLCPSLDTSILLRDRYPILVLLRIRLAITEGLQELDTSHRKELIGLLTLAAFLAFCPLLDTSLP